MPTASRVRSWSTSTAASGSAGSCHARAVVSLADLAQEEFVSLTTYRRSGEAVSVPVWIAPATDTAAGCW